jgi:DNA polymerase-3 subunit alpha
MGDAHGSSTQEPALVHVPPWDVRERLVQEKTALGFYLSGHLFDAWRDEVRRFARLPIEDLVDSRDPQLLAGIVTDPRVVNGARGRVLIFKLDDGSEAIEAVANEEMFADRRELMLEDALLIVQGKVQPDRFSGGLRLNVAAGVGPVGGARALRPLPGGGSERRHAAGGRRAAPVAAANRETEQGELRQGLLVRLRLHRTGATAELDLGDEARFWPSDEALARWRSLAHGGAKIVYE